ncbi:MAG: response regulator [Spirochaetes bacterium]|nr:response regulator [Spirochaetota bacterium]
MIRTIIVEDEVLIRIALRSKLESAGCEIIGESGDGAESIALIKKSPPDLLLLDIKLHGKISGIDILKEINRSLSIPTVFISAYDFEDYKDEISCDNMIAAYDKPLSDVDIMGIVDAYKEFIKNKKE